VSHSSDEVESAQDPVSTQLRFGSRTLRKNGREVFLAEKCTKGSISGDYSV
jgi:hypothetical protein